MFTKPGSYLGDTWYLIEDDTAHLFYLTCPQSTPRHQRWSIAHATSSDLVDWIDHGIILDPGEPGEWDGISTATGSVLKFDGRYYMAYTGNWAGPNPSAGLAVSEDLYSWEKLPGNPVTSIDESLYSATPNLAWNQPLWRDPFLFREDEHIHQLVTAAKIGAPPEVAGTVGLAVTTDMQTWEILPPLDVPALAQDLECPKLSKIGTRYYLTVSISKAIIGPHLKALQPAEQTVNTAYTLVADAFEGPYTLHGSGRILDTQKWGAPYACEPVCFRGEYFLMGTLWNDDRPDAVCNPIPIEPTEHGFKARERHPS